MLDLEREILEGAEPMKARDTDETFGERLAEARQRRGLTQAELGKAVGASQRVIAYYEGEGGQPPGVLLAHLARILKVTTDELLGLKPVTEKPSPKTARMLKRLRKIEDLPVADQRTVLKLLDALHESRQRASRPRAEGRAAT
jgi:transcriptional regulator with XRE-family HTH domain